MKQPILLVMAAGMGSRYGGLKQMDPMGAPRRNHYGLQPVRWRHGRDLNAWCS